MLPIACIASLVAGVLVAVPSAYASVTVPQAPTGVVATPGNGSAVVKWTAPVHNGGSPITGYVATATPGSKTCTTTGSTIKTCTVHSLTNGTTYSVSVKARNAKGLGAASAHVSVKPGVPLAPTGVKAIAGNAEATVRWNAPSNNGSTITRYTVTSSPGSKTCITTGTTTCTVTGLTNGDGYTFTVTATNAIGTGAASAVSGSVTPATIPGTPTGVTATAGNAQATVTWNDPSDGGSFITGYIITPSSGSPVTVDNGTATGYIFTGLTNGDSYTFTVTATNAIGTGATSAVSGSVTPATVPGTPTGVAGHRWQCLGICLVQSLPLQQWRSGHYLLHGDRNRFDQPDRGPDREWCEQPDHSERPNQWRHIYLLRDTPNSLGAWCSFCRFGSR